MTVYDYDDPGYAQRSLAGGVVRIKDNTDHLALVDGIDKTFSVIYRPVTFDGLGSRKTISFKDLDVSPIPLGYTQAQLTTAFLSRQPRRQWLQSTGQVKVRSGGRVRTDTYAHFLQPAFKLYPKIGEAVRMVSSVFTDVAISRDFALYDDLRIAYRAYADHIGKLDPVKYSVHIQPEFKFVAELLTTTFPELRVEE